MKRIFCFYILMLLTLILFAGCGCLLPDVPCIPGVRKFFSHRIIKNKNANLLAYGLHLGTPFYID